MQQENERNGLIFTTRQSGSLIQTGSTASRLWKPLPFTVFSFKFSEVGISESNCNSNENKMSSRTPKKSCVGRKKMRVY